MSRVTLEEHRFDGGEPTWYFVSEGAETTIVRTLDGEAPFKTFRTGDRPDPLRAMTAAEADELGGRRPRKGDAEAARNAIEAFEKAEADADGGTFVPITPLRQFYGLLKRELCPRRLHGRMADAFAAEPEGLCRLVNESVEQMPAFDTSHPFHGARNTPLPEVDRLEDATTTHMLVGHLSRREGPFEPLGTYVDYEVSTLNAPGSVFHTGRGGGSLCGGADLLFVRAARDASGGDRMVPVVCEAKIEGDSDPFAALVQALVYATEFATPSQTRRLKAQMEATHADEAARIDDETPRVAAVALIVRPNSTQRGMVEATRTLAASVAERCEAIDSCEVVVL